MGTDDLALPYLRAALLSTGMRIAIFASYARDTVTIGSRVTVSDGGPARFLSAACAALGVPYVVYSGAEPADVRVTVMDGVERGSVARVAPILVSEHLVADASVVSTILDEFPFHRLPDLPGIVALDVQGFTRRPNGTRGPCVIPQTFWPHLDIVKATESECAYLDEEFVSAMRERTFVVTRGRNGATIWHRGARRDIPTESLDVPHALGAGDTFLTAFVVTTLRGSTPDTAGAFAVAFVRDWLTGVYEQR